MIPKCLNHKGYGYSITVEKMPLPVLLTVKLPDLKVINDRGPNRYMITY